MAYAVLIARRAFYGASSVFTKLFAIESRAHKFVVEGPEACFAGGHSDRLGSSAISPRARDLLSLK